MNRITATFLTALLIAGPALAGERISERADMAPNGTLEVSNVSGTVRVSGWDRAEVEVTGELGDDAERLDFDADGKFTRIKVELHGGQNRYGGDGTDLVIRVPESSRVTVTTVSADIELAGIRGAQRLHSVSGDIHTAVYDDDLEAQTVSGDVHVGGQGPGGGALTLTLVSGDARLEGVTGELTLNTVSGEVDVRGETLSRLRLATTSGDVTIRTQLAHDGRVDIKSLSGDVRLGLCGQVDAEFNLTSFSGDIEGFFGREAERTSKYAPGSDLNFTEGSGSGRVVINSMSGDIEFDPC